MSFASGWLLITLLAVPALVVAYRRLLSRRAARRAELARLGLVLAPASGTVIGGRRRHVAPLLFLTALILVLIGLARPQASVAEPRREGTVVLAFDVSASMAAKDLEPTRMEAAKAAARRFVEQQPPQIRIGVVSFGDNAVITQQPTTDRAAIVAAIDRLTPGGGTAVGRGLQSALTAIVGKPVLLNGSGGSGGTGGGGGTGKGGVEEQSPDLGFTRSAAVVLLSDGENTTEPDPQRVAELASTAGVRIYPIGLGSTKGTVLEIDGYRVATALDEKALQQLATTTDGQYFNAADATQLAQVYSSIELRWTVERRPLEITGALAGAAALLLVIGAALSWRWFGRVI